MYEKSWLRTEERTELHPKTAAIAHNDVIERSLKKRCWCQQSITCNCCRSLKLGSEHFKENKHWLNDFTWLLSVWKLMYRHWYSQRLTMKRFFILDFSILVYDSKNFSVAAANISMNFLRQSAEEQVTSRSISSDQNVPRWLI